MRTNRAATDLRFAARLIFGDLVLPLDTGGAMTENDATKSSSRESEMTTTERCYCLTLQRRHNVGHRDCGFNRDWTERQFRCPSHGPACKMGERHDIRIEHAAAIYAWDASGRVGPAPVARKIAR